MNILTMQAPHTGTAILEGPIAWDCKGPTVKCNNGVVWQKMLRVESDLHFSRKHEGFILKACRAYTHLYFWF